MGGGGGKTDCDAALWVLCADNFHLLFKNPPTIQSHCDYIFMSGYSHITEFDQMLAYSNKKSSIIRLQ